MSYILDALKQSERRRMGRATPPGQSSPPEPPAPPARPFYRRRLLWLLLLLVLALPIGYGLGRFAVNWLELASSPDPATTPAPLTIDDEPRAIEPPARQPIVVDDAPARILVEAPPAVSLNEPKPASSRPDRATPPSPDLPTEPVQQAAPPEPVFDPGVPDIRELPASIRSRLPALTLSVHIYSPDPAARMANINGQMLREGQNAGPVSIERITPKGVVLRFQGNDFHLGSVGG
ncbi:general secretion pathway protein GspB [Oceanimonas marisflavi]|uniref:general secretion pathway protein GspB n=1 Tax=Oceanimonas marisflavi TaxID=2059724 RepID=UPI000D2FD330|nr:general secretion pathway protein GspB [Oceanimonas marisflavi]